MHCTWHVLNQPCEQDPGHALHAVPVLVALGSVQHASADPGCVLHTVSAGATYSAGPGLGAAGAHVVHSWTRGGGCCVQHGSLKKHCVVLYPLWPLWDPLDIWHLPPSQTAPHVVPDLAALGSVLHTLAGVAALRFAQHMEWTLEQLE